MAMERQPTGSRLGGGACADDDGDDQDLGLRTRPYVRRPTGGAAEEPEPEVEVDVAAVAAAVAAAALPVGEDYAPLLEAVGDASIVLLGESTHGTDEFYRSRIALAQQLIERKGFSLVCIEGDWPATFRLNRYIQHADPAAADFYAGVAADGGGEGGRSVDGSALEATAAFRDNFPEWMWRNQPFVDFVEWLKERNMVASFDERAEAVSLYGLDLYSLHESARAVVAYRE